MIGTLILAVLLSVNAAVGQEQTLHPEKAVCRVCAARSTHGEEPEPEKVEGWSTHEGEHYYFCSPECKAEFDASPEWWVPMKLPFPVPGSEVRGLDGVPVSLALGDGRWTVLDFWATWCQPCKKTMRELQKRIDEGSWDLRVVGLSIDEGEGALEKVRRYVRSRSIRYPIFLDDGDTPLWTALTVRAVPTMMLIDGRGNVVWRYTGPDGDRRLDEAIAAHMPPIAKR